MDINNDVNPAYQLRRYGWTTKLPLSILSDFEEFAVYDWMSANRQFLSQLPIPRVDPDSTADKPSRDRIAQLAEQMLTLHQRLSTAKTPQEKTALERQIAATDTQIDRLVYDLYALTEEEIKIVEGATP